MYRIMSFWMSFRAVTLKPMQILQEIGLKDGQKILDYGAGPGVFTIPAAQLVGSSGEVIAVDIHPMSKKIIDQKAKHKKISNVTTILANINTGLRDQQMDVVLLFDVLHLVEEKSRLMKELHRLLKTGGKLFIKPDHLSIENLKTLIKSDGMFIHQQDFGEILKFQKIG